MMFVAKDRASRESQDPNARMTQACLKASFLALSAALDMSKEIVGQARKGEPANLFCGREIVAKVKCESAVIDTFSRHDLPIRLVSNGHGTKNIHPSPRLLLVLDGLDHEASFLDKGDKGSHGAVLSVFSSIDPTYNDYLCAGMADFRTGRLYLAVRGKGLEMHEGGRSVGIHLPSITLPGRKVGDSEPTVCGNGGYGVFGSRLRELTSANHCSGVESMRRMFEGKCDGIVDSTCGTLRESNIGQAVLNAMVSEAGGVVISLEGEALGPKSFLTFGQLEAKGIVAARNPVVAETLRQKLVA